MKIRKTLLPVATHVLAILAGFGLGIYMLPILIAPPAPDSAVIAQAVAASEYRGEFSRARQDSDALHWGEGTIAIGPRTIAFTGELAPGPDYKLYFSPTFVETEAEFMRLKPSMVLVGDIKTFDSFVIDLPPAVDPVRYTTAIVWCETFGQFITSGRYR